MMEALFLKLLNMSITAGYLILAVIVLRFLFKKAPKWITCLLWGLVGLRLIFPFSVESVLSLIPSSEPVPQSILISQAPEINSGFPVINQTVNPIISETLAPNPADSATPIQIITFIAAIVWLCGIVAMISYMVISFLRLKFKVKESVKENGYYICDNIPSPFILGFVKPKIYLPSNLNLADTEYVLAHENAHLRRKDHFVKPLAFLILSVYWFNPLLWVAYILLCRDIELACDEKVMKNLGEDFKKDYSTALINCSISKRAVTACPLAFGEIGVKARIKNVLSYKKPTLWIIIAALVISIVASVCFLTNPKQKTDGEFNNYFITYEYMSSKNLKAEDIALTFDNNELKLNYFLTNLTDSNVSFDAYFAVYKKNVDENRNVTREEIVYDSPWIDLAYILQNHGTSTETCNITKQYGELKTGDYIFEKEFRLNGETAKLTVHFTLSYTENLSYTPQFDTMAITDARTIPTHFAMVEPKLYLQNNDLCLEFTLENVMSTQFKFSKQFKLEKEKVEIIDGVQNYSYPEFKTLKSWSNAGKTLEPNGSTQFKYNLTEQFGVTKPGKYIFKQDYSENGNSHTISIIFKLSNSTSDESTSEIVRYPVNLNKIHISPVNWSKEGERELWQIAEENNSAMYDSDPEFCPVVRIDTNESLNRFYNKFNSYFDFNSSHGLSSEGFAEFSANIKKYKEDNFEDEALLLIYVPSADGNNRYGINGITGITNHTFHISVIENTPANQTDDMAGWIIGIEVSKDILDQYEFTAAIKYPQ